MNSRFLFFLFYFLTLVLWPVLGHLPYSFPYNIITFNLNNYGDDLALIPLKNLAILDLIKETRPTFLALQEVKNEDLLLSFLQKEKLKTFDLVVSTQGGRGNQKLGLLYDKKNFTLLSSKEIFLSYRHKKDRVRPLFHLTFEEKNTHELWSLFLVHLKAGGWSTARKKRERQLTYLGEYLQNYGKDHLKEHSLFLGDFNTTDILRRGEEESFSSFVFQNHLLGSYKNIKCSAYFRGAPSLLDHILYLKTSRTKVLLNESEVLGPCRTLLCSNISNNKDFFKISDHCPIRFSFSPSPK